MSLSFSTDIQYVKGVGPKAGDLFRRRGIETVRDLLYRFPRAYEDRRAVRDIQSLVPDQLVSIKAQILKVRSIPLGKSRRRIWEVVVADNTGRIPCKYFRIPYKGYFERFQPNQMVRVVGKVTHYRGTKEFHHPDLHPVTSEEPEENALIPIYTEIEGISRVRFSKLVHAALSEAIHDPLPPWIRERYDLLPLEEAIRQIHEPPLEQSDLFLQFRAPAQRRLIFDEFFQIELHMALRRQGIKREAAVALVSQATKVKALEDSLPFELTSAQRRTFLDIVKDLANSHPMHRLVQGDVGSGKTMVALMSAVYAIEAGAQVALMAPTEILSEQHFRNAERFLGVLGVRVGLLTGNVKGKERSAILLALKSGEIDLLIGTHALIQEDVEFQNLGLVIVDEQHRFGVEQRNKLKRKGIAPHFLVMTATPIPRTLAMTVYGDLDVSLVDEMPKGRMPILTRKTFASKRPRVIQFVHDQMVKGRQAYIVYPLVEESEELDLKNATEEFERIQAEMGEYKVGLLHGRMKSAEKDAVMRKFRDGKIHVLVATTVIEVGVDVPNANIIVIEHAERFGLSQLHQLRGRVGRGDHKSYCILVLGYALGDEAIKRAEIMESTTDGFKLAEADLEMRGPGEFLGTRQSGLPGFRLANLVRDSQLLTLAKEAAFELIAQDPKLKDPSHARVKAQLEEVAQAWVG